MKIIDAVITSRLFDALINPVVKRRQFLNLREVYSIFGEPERRAYAEIYGTKDAAKRYGPVSDQSNPEATSTGSYESHLHARSRG